MGAAALVNVVCVLIYAAVTYRHLYNSDAAVKLILADVILADRDLLPDTWNYQQELWVLGIQLIAMPFVAIFGVSYKAHVGSALTSIVILLGTLHLVCRRLQLSRQAEAIVLLLTFAGTSVLYLEHVFGQHAYAIVLIEWLLTLWLLLRIVEGPNTWGLWLAAAGLFVMLVGTSAQGLRAPMTIGLPWAVTIALWGALEKKPRWPLAVALLLAGSVIGLGIERALKPGVLYHAGATLQFATPDVIVANVKNMVMSLLAIFGALPDPHDAPMTLKGMLTAYQFFVAIAVFIVAPRLAFSAFLRLKQPLHRLVAIAFVLTLVSIGYLLLFGTMILDETGGRYFLVCMLATFLLTGLGWDEWVQAHPWAAFVGVLALLPSVLFTVSNTVGGNAPKQESPKEALSGCLKEHDLHRGYATFWNANVVRVLSDNAVQLTSVDFVGTRLGPFRWHVDERWFRPEAGRHDAFLALTSAELDAARRQALDRSLGAPKQDFQCGDYHVMTYDFDIAERLGWTLSVDAPIAEAERHVVIAVTPGSLTGAPGARPQVKIVVSNRGNATLFSEGAHPVNVGLQLLAADGKVLFRDYAREPLPAVVAPQGELAFSLPVALPQEPGRYRVAVTLVQEGVAWFDADSTATIDVQVVR